MEWTDFAHVASLYPDEPRTQSALARTLFDIGRLLRISQNRLFGALKTVGPGRILLAFDYLFAKADTIRDPARYFDKMLAQAGFEA